MYFSKILCLVGLLAMVNAESTCRTSLDTYSDNTCTTKVESMTFEQTVGTECHQAPNQNLWLINVVCDANQYVALELFKDSKCTQIQAPTVHALKPGFCVPWIGSSSYVKVTSVDLTGNKYGIGWLEGWGIFICQTVLFGVCNGY